MAISSSADRPRTRKQAVTTHTQELEALEARLRETEERLKNVKSSPPSRKASQRQTTSSDADKAPSGEASSPLAMRQKTHVDPRASKATAGAQSESSTSDNSTEYVLVDRPQTAPTDDEEST
jgi:Tfp pilus assembly protein PilX